MNLPFDLPGQPRRIRRWQYLFPIVALLLASPQARASDTDTKKRAAKPAGLSGAAAAAGPSASKASRERAAKRACLTGDAEGGVALLTDLYIDTNDPTYLFNQGRCFEQNRRYEDAIGRFREYLIKAKGLGAEDRADTERHIAACESYLRPKPAEATRPETPTVATTPVAPTAVLDRAPPQEIVAAPEPSPGRAGSGLRIAGLMVGGVGAAGLVTGLVLNLKVNSMSSDLENEYDPNVESSRKGYKTGAWIGYGVGAACLVGGAVLYSLGWMRGKQANTVALVPAVASGMAGTVLLGVF